MVDDIRTTRNLKIDYLRMIGTILVIMAHMGAPEIVQNIRTFDVTMLVFISGMSFVSSSNTKFSTITYIKKRIKKLLLPTYILISTIFILAYIACELLQFNQLFDLITIIKSFLFLNGGIGYIWVVRVYLIIAVFAKIMSKFSKQIHKNYSLLFICFCGFIFCDILANYFYGKSFIIDSYLFDALPYCFVALLGMHSRENKSFLRMLLYSATFLFIILQISYGIFGYGFSPNDFKYPPQLYYIVYGIATSCILYNNIIFSYNSQFVIWFSNNSFVIYLLHILILFCINLLIDIITIKLLNIWYIKFILVLFFSCICCYMFNFVIRKVERL